jgi:hypothetical protein
MGLAKLGTSPAEDQLTFNFRLLQAMDRVSLALCCTNEPFDGIKDLPPRPGMAGRTVQMRKSGETGLIVDPWIFDQDELRESVPCRCVPARAYADDDDLRTAYAAASIESLEFTLRRIEGPTS